MAKKNRVTISDIAKRVNMTNITVSRALSKPEKVKPDTLKKILAVAEELNYVPNAFAQSLKQQTSHIIGIVTASIDNPFYGEMIKAISRKAKENNFSIMLFDTDGQADLEDRAIQTLLSYDVAGIILSPISDDDSYAPGYIKRLNASHIPTVLVDRTFKDSPFSQVVLDNFRSGQILGEYIARSQSSNVMVLSGPEASNISKERYRGFTEVFQNSSNDTAIQCCFGDYTFEPAYRLTLDHLQSGNKPDAIVGFNQLMTLGALKALNDLGMDESGILIAGIDKLPYADIFHVTIPTVRHDAKEVGHRAFSLLCDRMISDRKEPECIVVSGLFDDGVHHTITD